jgi:hypothetical protein
MSTIKVRKISLDHLGLKTSRLLYNELPIVRSMVHNWFDGNPVELLKKESASFLRRLVVRSLREISASHEAYDSYGGTSSEESSKDSSVTAFLSEISPLNLVRDEDTLISCAACSVETFFAKIVKSKHGFFYGICDHCYQDASLL